MISEDIHIELLELLELYCELLIARFGILDMKYVGSGFLIKFISDIPSVLGNLILRFRRYAKPDCDFTSMLTAR